ncbi:MAG: hypothetical protein VW258_09430 [Thalassolituus sp.]
MEERLQRVESEVHEMRTIAVQAISETRHATGAVRELTAELKNLAQHMAKSEERHTNQQAINERFGKRLDGHDDDIRALMVDAGRNDVMTGAMWSVWLKVGGSVAVAGVIGGLLAKAGGLI